MKKAWLPVIILCTLIVGVWVGWFLFRPSTQQLPSKLQQIMQLINDEYVDPVDADSILDAALPEMLAALDPHSVYIPASELQEANDELEGQFSGVGIQFSVVSDTVRVVESIPGGPAEKMGIVAGDKIIQVNDSSAIGWSNTDVFKHLRGANGSEVKLLVLRGHNPKVLTFNVKRGDIPVTSILAAYIIKPGTGFLKINKFGAKTYNEFMAKMLQLKTQGAKDFIIDLRGNGGGFMEPAVRMANEFLEADMPIVSVKGRKPENNYTISSDGTGTFTDAGVTVLIDEYSASASEIFAGAIQDNDRGQLVGRRSFGKGLVQNQFQLPDSSAIRLTIARYYTPSGRCIQKTYDKGLVSYENEINERYLHGEFYNKDSVRLDKSQAFKTLLGRTVYGGGGIMPDIFVANDTTGLTSYYMDVFNAGIIDQYAFDYNDRNRSELKATKTTQALLSSLPSDDELLTDFVTYAKNRGVAPRWYYINISRVPLLQRIKAMIVSDALGSEHFYEAVNEWDTTIDNALKTLK